MIFLIEEYAGSTIFTIQDKIYEKFSPSCLKIISDSKLDKNNYNMVEKNPLLFPAWCITYTGNKISNLKKLARNKDNVILVIVYTSAQLETWRAELNQADIPYSFISHKPMEKNEKLLYISSKLGTGDSITEYLYNRVKGSASRISSACRVLNIIGDTSKATIKKYIPESFTYGPLDVVNQILFVPKKVIKKESLVKVLYRYKNAHKYILETIVDYCDKILYIRQQQFQGVISCYSVDKKELAKMKELKSINRYVLTEMIESITNVSSEWIMLVQSICADALKKKQSLVSLMTIIDLLNRVS